MEAKTLRIVISFFLFYPPTRNNEYLKVDEFMILNQIQQMRDLYKLKLNLE